MKKKSFSVGKCKIVLEVATIIMVIIAVSLAVSTQLQKNVDTKTLEIANSKKQEVMGNNTTPQNAPTTSNWNMHIEYDTENTAVPVPNGYVGSSATGEHTINTGFVIYEGTDAVTDANLQTAQKTRNQWVWVPVYDVSTMYGIDSTGKMWGKLYNYNENGRTANNWSETNGVMKITDEDGYKEPTISGMTSIDGYISQYITEKESDELIKELTIGFEETMESIKKYGGFYIGRYETGSLSTTAKVVKGNKDISKKTWYYMYDKCRSLNGINDNVKTQMIYGSMWDYTMEWLVESGSKTYNQISKDSKDWGNYKNSTVTGHGSLQTTGYSESWKANNIYDMAGNVLERTAEESKDSSDETYRGGDFNSNGDSSSASSRSIENYYRESDDNNLGCRATLYIEL